MGIKRYQRQAETRLCGVLPAVVKALNFFLSAMESYW